MNFETFKTVCPKCDGKGKFYAHYNTGTINIYEHFWGWENCSLCKATGVITDDQLEKIKGGIVFKNKLKESGLTMFDAAEFYGVSVSQISAVINGRISFDEMENKND